MEATQISEANLTQFIEKLLLANGVSSDEADIIAKIFIWFDLIGRHPQGVGRLAAYIKRLDKNLIQSPCHPEFFKKSDTTWLIDGQNGFGHYLGHVAMSKAIEIAQHHGVGIVGVRHSNHFGAGAYYVNLAAQQNLLGLAVSNSVPHVAPPGAISAVLGTNPFAFAAPVRDQPPILVDFSTGASAGSEIMQAAKENRPIPPGLVIDEAGNDITDPHKAVGAVMLPFGGAKGYCLGLMIEILSGVLTGAAISHQIASLHKDFSRPANIGHFFMAIDIATLLPLDAYFDRIDLLIDFIKQAKLGHNVAEILLPGETRWRNYKRNFELGIKLDSKTVEALTELAQATQVEAPW